MGLMSTIPRRNDMTTQTKTRNLTGLILTGLLTASLTMSSIAHADRGHRHHRHHDHHRHHHHDRHDHHRHSGGHVHIYNQAPAYYRQNYPQPQQYGYYPPVPAPVYVVPPQMMMGINTGRVDFMLRF